MKTLIHCWTKSQKPIITESIQLQSLTQVVWFTQLEDMESAAQQKPDLCILEDSGSFDQILRALQSISESSYDTRILVLSTSCHSTQRIELLKHGASLVVPLPVHPVELRCYIEKLKRSLKIQSLTHRVVGPLVLDTQSGSLSCKETQDLLVVLQPREVQILEVLQRYINQVVPRELLIQHIWGDSPEAPAHNTVDVYIRALRIKLHHYSKLLQTVRGFGYRLVPE